MRQDPLALRPEPDGDEVLVFARREVHEPVHAAPQADGSPALDMVHEELRRVAGLGCLLRREQAFLRSRDLVEAVVVRAVGRGVGHAQNVSDALCLCNPTTAGAGACHPRERSASRQTVSRRSRAGRVVAAREAGVTRLRLASPAGEAAVFSKDLAAPARTEGTLIGVYLCNVADLAPVAYVRRRKRRYPGLPGDGSSSE